MKNLSKKHFKALRLALVIVMFIVSSNINALVPPPALPYKPKTSVPLDGGLAILLAGAAAFGVRKLRKNKVD
ncbi:hypothetical protein MHTCC0001_18310 [Flavobacteriaceae bacterium MHTCC 0001]